jgi:hypothetical protein
MKSQMMEIKTRDLAQCSTAFNVLIMPPFWAPYLVCIFAVDVAILG